MMGPLIEGQETGVQQQLSLEDPQSSLKWSLPSKQREEHLPAPMRKKQLPWNQHYPGHLPTPTILQSPYSFAQTVSPSVKLSFNPILRHSQSTILYCLPSSFNGSLAILLFQVTILQTKQLKKPPPCPQIQFFLFFYLVPFSLLTKPFVTL